MPPEDGNVHSLFQHHRSYQTAAGIKRYLVNLLNLIELNFNNRCSIGT